MADDYTELAGRTIGKEPTRVLYRTRGVATLVTDSTAPSQGDALSGTSHTIPPICQKVDIDEIRYPKRFLFNAIWEGPLTRAEFSNL